MKISSTKIGHGVTYFVIEEGQANLGNFKVALKMIDTASKTGANAIEFQLAKADEFYVKNHKAYYKYLEREFSNEELNELVTYTKSKNLDLIVAPFSTKIVEAMTEYGCAGFNINGSDLTTPDIIDAVADSGLPFFLSLILATDKEISWAVNRIIQSTSSDFALLLGQHSMASGGKGVALKDTNLGYIKTLKKEYGVPVGYIDHSPSLWSAACAVASGADIVTKHLAISRDDKGPDWQICLEPNEMKQCVSWVRKIQNSLNNTIKVLAPGEEKDRLIMRRSIVSTRDLNLGTIIQKGDIAFKRPGTGVSPDKYSDFIGMRVNKQIKIDDQINYDDIK